MQVVFVFISYYQYSTFHFLIMRNNFKSKFYRFLMAFFPVAEDRRGECLNCGACCQLPVKCFFLKFEPDGKSYCSLRRKIGFNSLQCRKYPRTKKEWLTPGKCGYRFD